MSKRRIKTIQTPQETEPHTIPQTVREQVATEIAQKFNRLTPADKRTFTDETLTALVNMDKRQMQKMFSKLFFKKGQPTKKDLETINQLITVFLYSIKDEFRLQYAAMIYKAFKMPLPENLPEKLGEIRGLEWLHFGVSSEVAQQLYECWDKKGQPDYDAFFTNLLRNSE